MSFKNHFAFNFLIKAFPNPSCYGKLKEGKSRLMFHMYIFISSHSYAVPLLIAALTQTKQRHIKLKDTRQLTGKVIIVYDGV